MTDGDSEADADNEAAGEDDGTETEQTVESFEQRLADAEADLEAAETESDLDAIETTLSEIEDDLETADLPEPEDDDAEDPVEVLQSQLSDLRDDLDERRGPYVEDVAELVETAAGTVLDTRWTDDGEAEVLDAVAEFRDAVAAWVDVQAGDTAEAAGAALESASDEVAALELDPDEDAEHIATLLEAGETLTDNLEAAEGFDDLTVRAKLEYDGFYEVLEGEHRKDFPPELNAVLSWEKKYKEQREPANVEPILQAFELLGSEFMEENILDSFERIAPPEAFDAVHQRAQRRDKQAVRVLGKIGDERAVETLVEFIDGDGDPALQRVTLRALGEIGSEDATQVVANRLLAENTTVRSAAARALGLLGDTRAIEPLADVLDDDESDDVRASAAWALNQIGTERALEVAAEYADDRAYVVQVEAEKAAGA